MTIRAAFVPKVFSPRTAEPVESTRVAINTADANLFPSAQGVTPQNYSGPTGHYKDMSPQDQKTVNQAVETTTANATDQEKQAALTLAGTGAFTKSGPFQVFRERSKQYRDQQPNKLKGVLGTVVMGGALAVAELQVAVQKPFIGEDRPYVRDPNIIPVVKQAGKGMPSGHAAGYSAVDGVALHLGVASKDELAQEVANGSDARVVLGVHDFNEIAEGARLGTKAANAIPSKVVDWLALPAKDSQA